MSQTVRPSNPARNPARGAPAAGRSAAAAKPGTAKPGTTRPDGRPAMGPGRTRIVAEPAPQGDTAVGIGDALEWLWRFFISRRTGLVLILVLGLASLVGTSVRQVPAEIRSDPQAYASWLDAARPTFGGWTSVLDFLGVFSTFSSWWFKGTLVLLTTSIVACSAHRIPQTWRRVNPPANTPPEAFYQRAALGAEIRSGAAAVDALEQAAQVLRRNHFRTALFVRTDGGSTSAGSAALCADRFRWAPFGSIVAHLGFVVVLLGAFLSASTGFKDTQFVAPVGTKVEVGHGTGLTLEARSFNDAYYDNGSPKDYASDVVIYRKGVQVTRQTIRVNEPLSYGGVSFYQSFFGTAASIQVADGQGRMLTDTAVPLTWRSDDGKHTIGQLAVPGQKLTVYVVMPASGEVDPNIAAGQVRLEIYQPGSDAPTATQTISQGKPQTIGGLSYTFVRERQFTGLIVARDPGVWFVWIGSLLLIAGIFAVFFFPHRRVWVAARRSPGGGTTLQVAAHLKRDAAFEPRFRALVADLEKAAGSSAPQGNRAPGDAPAADADPVDADPVDADPDDIDPDDIDPDDIDPDDADPDDADPDDAHPDDIAPTTETTVDTPADSPRK